MEIKAALKSQYLSALEILKNTIVSSDEETWLDDAYKNSFWHIAYHALYFTDLYLSDNYKSYIAWEKHRKEYHVLGKVPWPPYYEPEISQPYTKDEMIEFLEKIKNSISEKLESCDLEAPSGFEWLPINKLELHIYNIRHLTHHTGQLSERLRSRKDIGTKWIMKTV